MRTGLWRVRRAFDRVRSKRPRVRVVIERGLTLGDFSAREVAYDVSLSKEQIAREHIFALPGEGLTFLDVGARDGRLDYLLGIRQNLHFDSGLYERNLAAFQRKFRYYGVDLEPEEGKQILVGDVCSEYFAEGLPEFHDFFDVIYSNNVFEHLRQPWTAARNLLRLLSPGGICITIAPFSLRYHESPADYFRYSHTGLTSLFEDAGDVDVLVSGYDTSGRRNNWQGCGAARDIVPVDSLGAWRENWFTVAIVRKRAA
jgi:SAM-dependent methyltransferase